ncbi:MAG TPA: heliorhodopsin HeR [Baekduia sp.]|nr:heliorhodopsin HeR [Baekduia sp.]
MRHATTPAGELAAPRGRDSLRTANVVVGLLHAAQALVLLAIASDAALPVTTSFLTGPPGSGDYGATQLFELAFAPAVAAFLLLAAADHLLMAAPRVEGWYRRNVAVGRNPARWSEYAISASLMVVLIAMLAGVREAAALIALFGVNAAMIFFGLVSERVNRPGQPVDWRPFAFGCVAGAVPWIAIGLQLAVSEAEGGDVPAFVVAIFVTLLLLFNSFAVNMALQLRGVGRWRDPLFAERMYLVLSLVAKSALAWQVYAGALAGS